MTTRIWPETSWTSDEDVTIPAVVDGKISSIDLRYCDILRVAEIWGGRGIETVRCMLIRPITGHSGNVSVTKTHFLRHLRCLRDDIQRFYVMQRCDYLSTRISTCWTPDRDQASIFNSFSEALIKSVEYTGGRHSGVYRSSGSHDEGERLDTLVFDTNVSLFSAAGILPKSETHDFYDLMTKPIYALIRNKIGYGGGMIPPLLFYDKLSYTKWALNADLDSFQIEMNSSFDTLQRAVAN